MAVKVVLLKVPFVIMRVCHKCKKKKKMSKKKKRK